MTFGGCSNLRDIYIPSPVKAVAGDAFYGDSSLSVHYAGSRDEMFASRGWSSPYAYGVKEIRRRDGLYDETFRRSDDNVGDNACF